MRIGKNFAVALVIAAVGAGSARAAIIGGLIGEALNTYVPLPPSSMTGGATSFAIVFQGNVTSSIDTSTTAGDSALNPFLFLNNQLNNGGTTSVTAAVDGNGNTVVTFTGSNPITSSTEFGFENGLPHLGLSSSPSGPAALDIISQTWSNSSSSFALPGGVSVSVVNGSPADPFVVLFAAVTSNGNTVGQWFELPYTAGTTPQLAITNYTANAETLSDVGYFLSSTQIPLDDLNFGLAPPPGTPGSPFIPLPNLDGQTLAGGNGIGGAGGTIGPFSVPEPSSIISLGMGLLVVAGCFARRRFAARHRPAGPGRLTERT